jgi:hypothetical protein
MHVSEFPPVRTSADLCALWQRLMGSGGFGRASIWVVFLDADGAVQPVIMPVDDIPPEPDAAAVRNLARAVADVFDDGTGASVVLLLSRGGPPAMTDADRRWARALVDGFRGLTRWPVHLATRDRVQVFAPDDLIAA